MRLPIPISYCVQTEKSSPKFASAFARGCGGAMSIHDDLQPGPLALFGSPARQRLLAKARADGRDWYYGDHGYGRRFVYYRVTRNALQYTGPGSTDRRRWDELRMELYPTWRKGTSGAIVICPNSAEYMSWFGIDARQWVLDLVAQLLTLTDRPIIVRWKARALARPLYLDLHDAYLLIAFSSAAAVEALAAGVPVCTLAPWASTARMGIASLAEFGALRYPDITERDEFLFALANNQWTIDEMVDGLAWKWFCAGKDRG